jgi:hypothetical protein
VEGGLRSRLSWRGFLRRGHRRPPLVSRSIGRCAACR